MKLALPKIRLGTSVGVYLTDTHVAWCVMAKVPFGVRQVDAGHEPSSKAEWPDALNRIVSAAIEKTGSSNVDVVIGLPTSHTFYATLPAGGKNDTAETLLAGNHCCSSIPPGDLSADMLPLKLAGKPFAAVAASRRKDLQILNDVVRKLGVRNVRVEPAPWALLRVSKSKRGGSVTLRLFSAEGHMLAILANGSMPLLWRAVECSAGGEDAFTATVLSLVRALETFGTQQLGLAELDAVILEGAQAAPELSQRLNDELGGRFTTEDGPGPTLEAISKGLAVGGLERDKPAPDLARSIAPPPHLWDLVPRGEVAMLGAVVVCMGLWLWTSGTIAQNRAKRAEDDNARSAMLASGNDAKLVEEKKQLTAEVNAVTNFLSNRIVWTEYLNQLSDRLPPGVKIVNMIGEFEMPGSTEKAGHKPKKGLSIMFTADVPHGVSAPPEVDAVLAAVRQTPAIARDFPDVKLSSLRVSKAVDSGKKSVRTSDPATFVVMCLPKSASKAGAGGAGGAVAEGDKAPVARTE